MGINVNGLRFLLLANLAGVDYRRTAMIGRQALHMSYGQLKSVLGNEGGVRCGEATLKEAFDGRYLESVLQMLGSEEVHSFDNSDYEAATHCHDFNIPIPAEHHGRYSAVIDGGTLEHIFQFPTAIRNCMEMLAVGGHFLGLSPTNNYNGHGFYQLSPELYFRVFNENNGFRLKCAFVHEGKQSPKWYKVRDPHLTRGRAIFRSPLPAMLLILAQKTRQCQLFGSPTYQSDYEHRWDQKAPQRLTTMDSWIRSISKTLSPRFIVALRNLIWPMADRSLFEPFDAAHTLRTKSIRV